MGIDSQVLVFALMAALTTALLTLAIGSIWHRLAQLMRALRVGAVSPARLARASSPESFAHWVVPGRTLANVLAPWVKPDRTLRHQLRAVGLPPDFDERALASVRVFSGLIGGTLSLGAAAVLGFSADWLLIFVVLATLIGLMQPIKRVRRVHRLMLARATASFPGFLDGLALALEAGLAFPQAFSLASARIAASQQAAWIGHLRQAAQDLRAGQNRGIALGQLEAVLPIRPIQQFAAAAITAERSGMSLAPIFYEQASLARELRHHEVERQAMQAPVKLLGPLMICIFPCTFLVLLAPLIASLQDALL